MALHRTLFLRTETTPIPVPIEIDEATPDDRAWRCSFRIAWPGGVIEQHAFGVDGVQATLAACQLIAILLYASDYHADGLLYFSESLQGYGFPLPPNGKDQAVGLDTLL